MASRDLSRKIAETANRIRLVQISLADESDDERRAELSFEIERALSDIVPAERRVFIEELMQKFPTWTGADGEAAGEVETPAGPQPDESKLNDPYYLVRKLQQIAPTLTDAQKRELSYDLGEAGLAPSGSGAWSTEAERDLQELLKVKGGQPIDADRALRLLASLVELASSLDQFAGTTWHTLSGKTGAAQRSQMRETFRRLLEGDREVSTEQVKNDLDKLRQLSAALLAAVGRAAGQFARNHVKRFAPSTIEDWVRMEGVGILQSFEVKCWKKYGDVAKDLTENAIESEIMELIVKSADQLMEG